MISAAIRGNVLGCGNYRKSLSFDLVTRSVLHQTPTTNPLLLLEDRFKNSPLPFPLPPFRNRACSLFPPLSAPEKRIETKYGGERMAMWMVNFWIYFGEKKTQRRSRKIGGKWKVKEIGGDAFPPSVPSPTWIGTRAVRQSRGAGRTIPQSGGFEKYLTIIHGGRGSSTSRPNIVATKSHARIHFPFPFLHFKFSPGLRDRNRQFPIRSTSSSAPFFFRLPGGGDILLRGDIVQDFLLRKNAPIYTLPSGRVVPRFFNIRRSRAKWDDDSKNYNSVRG